MHELKKKHTEILALYALESELLDLYVEGNLDKAIIETFLTNKKVNKKVVPIDRIDFSAIPLEYFDGMDPGSNKAKLIILSKLLHENLPSSKVNCIVDKDFDDFISSISNNKLLKTDFTCLESYLFCEEVVEKFLKIGIGNFPFNSKFILDQLAGVLKSLFCLRLIRELNCRSAELLQIDRHLSIDKITGTVNFSGNDYITKFLHKNQMISEKANIETLYTEMLSNLQSDIRHCMHGHDFIEILFLYINKIKNTTKFKSENFGRSLFLTLESSMVENYPLFKALIA